MVQNTSKCIIFSIFFRNFLNTPIIFRNNFRTAFKLEILSKIIEKKLNAQNIVLNLVVHNTLTDPDLEFWIRVVSRSAGSGSAGSVAALVLTHVSEKSVERHSVNTSKCCVREHHDRSCKTLLSTLWSCTILILCVCNYN